MFNRTAFSQNKECNLLNEKYKYDIILKNKLIFVHCPFNCTANEVQLNLQRRRYTVVVHM